ncbi:MAG: hypothetical protein CMI02_03080 [Oceanospirillaceae bacterium]|nr:hypothetical protein [Oceanospirillaceae bacterium]MBT11000.1 hypothetical protein [Oceanospirillaceae bacterium]|tara:strand:- start:113272 stop:113550 length:279 start_codon:yes stop_codon:yes gene_type:complete
MSTPLDRFLLLLEVEGVKLPWLEERTGIKRKRWATVKAGSVEMRAAETEALAKLWPEYGYWLATGEELPEAGQISPMTKREQKRLKPTPKAG